MEVRAGQLAVAQRIYRMIKRLVRRVLPTSMPKKGLYASYENTLADANGYSSSIVIEQVEEATRAVLEGRAVYERDGKVFQSRPELAINKALEKIIVHNCRIADFGGALGSLYINTPELFPQSCQKLVIEQGVMVEAGRRLSEEFALGIEFIDSVEREIPHLDILVFSSVLQYLKDPWGTIEYLVEKTNPRFVIVDRTAVKQGKSQWHLQTNPGYYAESVTYPVQILELRQLMRSFQKYRPIQYWRNDFDYGKPRHIGMLLARKSLS